MLSLQRGCCERFQYLSHTKKIVHFIFVWKKKKDSPPPPQPLRQLSQKPFVYWWNNLLCIMMFYKYIYCLKNTFRLDTNTTSLHVTFGRSAKQLFSRMYKNTFHPEFKSRKHSRLVKSERQGIFISTIFVTSVTPYKVDIFLFVCSELASADS